MPTEYLTRENRVLPDHVRREFEDYLKCGRLENGFLLVLFGIGLIRFSVFESPVYGIIKCDLVCP